MPHNTKKIGIIKMNVANDYFQLDYLKTEQQSKAHHYLYFNNYIFCV
jgi:hypothetical protein